jgi:hypothetical protein
VKKTETSINQIEQRDWGNSAGSSQYFLEIPTFSLNYAGIFLGKYCNFRKNKRGDKKEKFSRKENPKRERRQ